MKRCFSTDVHAPHRTVFAPVMGIENFDCPGLRIRCRYLGRRDEQCTAEVVDDQGEILLCVKHLGRAMQLLNRAGAALANALVSTQ